jgi:hypothetical protein
VQLSRPKESRDLHRLARVAMWTKLRPGVREFLRRAAERFELWVYTAGSKAYADVSGAQVVMPAAVVAVHSPMVVMAATDCISRECRPSYLRSCSKLT